MIPTPGSSTSQHAPSCRNQGDSGRVALSQPEPHPSVRGFLCSQRPGPTYYTSACALSFCLLPSSWLTQPTPPTGCHQHCDLRDAAPQHFQWHHCVFCVTDAFMSISQERSSPHTAKAHSQTLRHIGTFLFIHKGPALSGLVNHNIKLTNYQLK